MIQKILEADTELEKTIEEDSLVHLKEGNVNKAHREVSLTSEEPRHPSLVLADHVAPDGADCVNSAVDDVTLDFHSDLNSLLLSVTLLLAILEGHEVHDQWA